MPQPRHKAVIAGLAVTLTLGGVALPAVATTSEAPASDSDPNGMGDPAPADYDKSDYYEGAEGTVTFATARSASRLAPVALSDEMKYFTKYESGCDYDKGLSYGDGYNAMGYYQFDRRYALMPFIQQVYSYNSTKYAMLKAPLAQRDMLANPSYAMYDYVTRQLTAPAQILNEAWHAAYAADPAEFAALQDAYAYNNYYLPAQSMLLNSYGVDVRDRADCVKGLVWGMCNLFGQGGVQKFFDGANITNSMTDRELVTALCDTVIGRVGEWYPGQPQYHAGWQNRYKKEKAACLAYIDQHDAEQAAAGQQRPNDAPGMGDPGMGVPGPGEAPGAGAPTLGATPGTSAPGTGGGGAAAMPDGDAASEPPAAQPNGPAAEPDAGRVPDAPVDEDSAPSAPESGPVDGSVNGEPTEDVDDGSNGVTPDSGLATGGTAPQGDSAPQSGSGLAQDPAAVGTDPVDQADAPATTDPATDEPVADPAVGDAAAAPVATGAPEKTPDATRNAAKKASSDAESTATPRAARASSGDLPDTGDIAAMVVTGAAGLAVAGTSFLSLAKKEREARWPGWRVRFLLPFNAMSDVARPRADGGSARARPCRKGGLMEAYKQEFIEFMVESDVLKFGDFTLKSGRKSPFFMNAGAYVTGEQLMRLGEYYARAIHDNFGLDFDVVFGPAYKGIPLSVVTAIAMHKLYGKEVRYCSDRKEVKDHGADKGGMLGYELKDGDRVVMVEDVTTSGKSIDETYPKLMNAANVEVKGLIVSLNRMEVGKGGVTTAQKEIEAKYGFPVASIVSMAEVTEHLYNREVAGRVVIDDELKAAIDAYYEQYGARE